MSLDPSDLRNEGELEIFRVHPKVQDPIGVTFTPTTVITSWFDDSNKFEYLTRPASPEFKRYYDTTVTNYKGRTFQDDRPHWNALSDGSKDDLKAMFALDFVPLTADLTERLGHEPTYLSLFLPSAFDRTIVDVGRQALKDINGSHPVTGLANQVMGLPWGVFEGSKLEREPPRWSYSEPELEYRPNLVLILEYETDYLYAFLHEVEPEMKPTIVVEYTEFSRKLGERFCKVSQPCALVCVVGIRADGGPQNVGAETYDEDMSRFIQDFKAYWLENSRERAYVSEEIRAIVIAGEVSPPAIAKLGHIAQATIRTGIPEILADLTTQR
jgi:hypothetical protein